MIHVLLLAGGSGTRFWPLSRKLYPKQFLSIIGDDPMIIKTINRLHGFVDKDNMWVLGHKDQSDCLGVLDSLIPENQILKEPVAKNTAACIGWGVSQVYEKDPDAVVLILPADAWIKDEESFRACLKEAVDIASKSDVVVTFGIKPRFAHTGYGYIKVTQKDQYPLVVDSFKEKPDKKTAEKYLKQSCYFWNAGIFVAKSHFLLSLFQDYLPNHYDLFKQINSSKKDKSLHDLYQQFESISIDHGIMEKLNSSIKLIPARFDWNDIGNWSSLSDYLPLDINNNASNSKVLSSNARNNLLYSKNKKLIALGNVNDLIVVETDDAILILPKDDDQSIKKLYERLEDEYK